MQFNRYAVGEGGRPSRTVYRVLDAFEKDGRKVSLVRLKLETGRTHQIRVHMAACGHPLLGDPIYGTAGLLGFSRAALHSAEIAYVLPGTDRIQRFRAELPEDFTELCNG